MREPEKKDPIWIKPCGKNFFYIIYNIISRLRAVFLDKHTLSDRNEQSTYKQLEHHFYHCCTAEERANLYLPVKIRNV